MSRTPPAPGGVRLREARPSDLRHLAGVENSGVAQFEAYLGDRMVPALASPAPSGGDRDLTGAVLVAVADDGPAGPGPVGFAHLAHQDSWGEWAHLEQLSVLPTHQSRGIGRALLEATRERARWDGHRRLSLCTYRDVPWNGPFYRLAGFEEVDEADLQPFQATLRAREQELGLDGAGPRCVMMVTLA